MAEVKWIKIVTDIFDDEKILIIESMPEADAMIVIWFKLLCLAGKQNNSGVFTINNRIAYTDEMFSAIFRRPINTVRLALKTFENLGMVEIVNGTVTIPNWGKHQSLDRIATRNEYMRNYMREYRERQKRLSAGDVDGTARKANGESNVIALEEEREIELDLDRNKENVGAEQPAGCSTPPPAPSEFYIPLNDGSSYNVPLEDIALYKNLYQTVDVEAELRAMIGWCISNPKRRKTNTGIKSFITRWLKKTQDKGGSHRQIDKEPPKYASEDDFY